MSDFNSLCVSNCVLNFTKFRFYVISIQFLISVVNLWYARCPSSQVIFVGLVDLASYFFFVLFISGLIGFLVWSKRHFKILFYFRPPFLGYTWSCCSVILSCVIRSCAPFLSRFHWRFGVATVIGGLYFSTASGTTKCHLRTLLYASVLRLFSPRRPLH
jgi:hypothetical protein